eukprot:jgi/Ulvmu1/5209/UM022_0002.1
MQGTVLSQISAAGITPGVRQDGRHWGDFRSLIVSNNAIGTSPASASVRLGNTFVLAGISTQVSVPSREEPELGRLKIQVDITPLASPSLHRPQAADTAADLSHTLNSRFTDPCVLDLHSLCVQAGQHCWEISVDICVLNDDGGLLDACMAAASSALRMLQLPDMVIDSETSKLVHQKVNEVEQYVPLDLRLVPLTMTFGMVDDELLCDPCQSEADHLLSSVEVTVTGTNECSGIELHGKSENCQSLMQAAIKHAHIRYSEVQTMFM